MASPVRRLAGVILAAMVFGGAVAVLKGNGPGVREAIGNTSAPWLLLPFIAGAVAGGRRSGQGAVVGALVSFVALGGFYVADTFVLDLGPHLWLVDLRLAVEGGRRYFALAVLSGPIFGALGALWQRERSVVLGVLMAASLVVEPLAWLVYEHVHPLARYNNHPLVWGVEVVIGVCTGLIVWSVTRHGRSASTAA